MSQTVRIVPTPKRRRDRGAGAKKYGRALKSPSHKRYNLENRREKNKARKAAKIAKMLERKRARKVAKI